MKPVAGDQYRTGNQRIGTIAILDTVATLIAAIAVVRISEKRFDIIAISIVFIIFVIIGIFVHVLIKQPTQLNYFLGLSPKRFDSETQKIIA